MGTGSGRRASAGRFRRILREDRDQPAASSLPMVFLFGLLFEVFLALKDQAAAEFTLNVVTVVGVVSWIFYTLFRAPRRGAEPLLHLGLLVLLVGASGGLLGLFSPPWAEIALKTLGAVLLVLALDRREKRQALMALKKSACFLESVFESIPDPLLILDAEGRVLDSNRGARRAFGGNLLRKRCDELDVDGIFSEPIEEILRNVLNSPRPRCDSVRDEASVRRYEVSTFLLSGPEDVRGSLIQQWRDVRSESAAEQRSDLLRDAVNSVQDPMLLLGLDGELLHSNRAAESLVGVDPLDAAPRRPEDLLPFRRNEDRETFVIALRDWGSWQREVKLIGPAESVKTVDLRLSPIRSAEDRRLGSVVLVRDVTEIKTLQMQLVQNEKLGSLGQLVSGVAHELNNPLTAVFGFAQLLLADDLPEKTKSEVRHIYTHAERCKKIIDGLLKFARPHQGERLRASLNEVVQGAVDLVRHPLKLANIQLELRLASGLPDSMMDPFLLQQVLINLMTNAQHAIEGAGREGKIRIQTSVSDEGELALQVVDNGCGIPKAVESKIFDPFFTTKGVGKGTGLGLSLCYGIVRDHGGRMRVFSTEGEGTRFLIELPVRAPPKPLPTSELTEAFALPVQPQRVLIVDDEPVILELLRGILEGEGHEVVSAEDGATALERAREQRFDAVFTDWRMPRMTGEELYGELIGLDEHYRGRTVFTTGDILHREVTKLAARDGNQLLKKPFAIGAVKARLACLVSRGDEATALPGQQGER